MTERVHPPTPRRRQQAKEQGRGPNVDSLQSSLSLLAGAALLAWLGPKLAQHLKRGIYEALSGPTSSWNDWLEIVSVRQRLMEAMWTLVPWLLSVLLLAVVARGLMRGRPRLRHLRPSLERLSVSRRASSLFSVKSLASFLIGLLQWTAMLVVSGMLVRVSMAEILLMSGLPVSELGGAVFRLLLRCVFGCGGVMLLFALVDFSIGWWQFEKSLMMTEQELRDEMREMQRATSSGQSARSNRVEGVSG